MPVTINGSGPIAGITSLNTSVSDVELGYLDGVTSAIQTQINTAGGLVKITDSSFTSGSSVILNNVFTSTYARYRLIMSCVTDASGGDLRSRMRLSGTNNTGATSYQRSGFLATATATLALSGGATDHFFHGATGGVSKNVLWMELAEPAQAESTCCQWSFWQGTGNLHYGQSAIHTVGTAYDGIELYLSAGAFTSGTVRVYGYRN